MSGTTANLGITNIGQICEISNLVYNLAWNDITNINDAAREEIIREIANLINEFLARFTVLVGRRRM